MTASFYDVLHKCSNDWLKYVLVQSQCGILWSSISLEEKINILGFLHRDNYQIVSKSITVGYVWPFRSSQATICHRNVTLKNSSEFVGIKAKGWISERVFQENKASQIFRKTNISHTLIRTCMYQGVRNVPFSENLMCFVFLKHPFWDSPFCFSTDELKINEILRTQNCINILYIICSIRGSNSSALFLIKHHFFVFSAMREKTTYKLVMDNYDFGLAKDKRWGWTQWTYWSFICVLSRLSGSIWGP